VSGTTSKLFFLCAVRLCRAIVYSILFSKSLRRTVRLHKSPKKSPIFQILKSARHCQEADSPPCTLQIVSLCNGFFILLFSLLYVCCLPFFCLILQFLKYIRICEIINFTLRWCGVVKTPETP